MLTAPQRVASAAEGQPLLASHERTETLADFVQRVVALTVPLVRAAGTGARFTRVPWVLVASTSVSTGLAVRAGVREVQVLGSLLAHRIEEATGRPPDPALVKKLTIDLYLAPKRQPDPSDRRLRVGRLVARWVFRGALGRDTSKIAMQALEAAERLDVGPLVARWAEPSDPSNSPAGPEGRGGLGDRR